VGGEIQQASVVVKAEVPEPPAIAVALQSRKHRQITCRSHESLSAGLVWLGVYVRKRALVRPRSAFQQYYLAVGSQRVENISGLTLNSSQFIPDWDY